MKSGEFLDFLIKKELLFIVLFLDILYPSFLVSGFVK